MLTTRFNQNISFYIFIATISTFYISLFLFQVFAVILIFSWIIENNKSKWRAFDKITILFLIFMLIRILSAITSNYPELSDQFFYKDGIFFLSFFAFSYYLKIYDFKRNHILVIVFVIAAVVVAIIGLINFNLGLTHRAQSITLGYLGFSTYLMAALGPAIFLIKSENLKQYFLYGLIGIGLMLAAVFVSLGRTNIVLAVLVFITCSLVSGIKKWILAVIILVGAISIISFSINSNELSNRMDQPATMSDRDIVWGSAIEIIQKFERPLLGYGPHTFKNIFDKRDALVDKGVSSWHNEYLQLYIESGILGLLSFLLFFGYALFAGIRHIIKNRRASFYNKIIIGFVISAIAMPVGGITSGFTSSPSVSVIFAFIIAYISATVFPVEPKNQEIATNN